MDRKEKESPQGKGYESFQEAFRKKEIDWGGKCRVLVTDEHKIITAYVCLYDGRLKIPAVCYDKGNENEEILGKDNAWISVDGKDSKSNIICGFGNLESLALYFKQL